MRLRIGTRKSNLALAQTKQVCDLIKRYYPDTETEIVEILTTGDKITDKNLYDIGGKALFLKEIEQHLLDNKIDIAVHSLKDVPGILPQDLKIAAVLARSLPNDVLVSSKYKTIDEIPKGAIIGSSSVRRQVIMQSFNSDLEFKIFRGNVQTRLQKLIRNEVDATILAAAGLIRLNILDQNIIHKILSEDLSISSAQNSNHNKFIELDSDVLLADKVDNCTGKIFFQALPVDTMLPAAGQGIIAIEAREENNSHITDILNAINHPETFYIAEAERSFLFALNASCETPISAYARFVGEGMIEAKYMIANPDGTNIRYHKEVGSAQEAWAMGIRAAKKLS